MSLQLLCLNNGINEKFFGTELLNPDYLFYQGCKFIQNIYPYIFRSENLDILKIILSVFCIFFVIIISYSAVRILEVRAKEHKHLQKEIEEYAHHQAEKQKASGNKETSSKNERWNNVLIHIFSSNPSDWKLAIIEADSMLESLMDQLNFKGENFGEKLKSADRDKFKNLTSAWEVHTIRNRIAHEGSAFEISQHEVKRVIALYEQIFQEFGYI